MWQALKRVETNRGAPGVDQMPVTQLRQHLKEHWPRIKEDLLGWKLPTSPGAKGADPQARWREAVARHPHGGGPPHPAGPKSGAGADLRARLLRIKLRFQTRPKRPTGRAKARAYVAEGRRFVVDLDLEKFFDRVNHDILMSRVARKVRGQAGTKADRPLSEGGIMDGGMTKPRTEGTPQGGPLSPLLSNILPDDLDRELERRGHSFCRYADDGNIYVKTRRGGERVMASITRFLETRLRLKVNRAKSAVDRPWKRKFLGYSMTWHKEPRLRSGTTERQAA